MSEPTPIELPVGLRWVKLVCRLGRLVTDSEADDDAHPDLMPVGGTLTLAASPSRVRIQEADGRWRSVELAGRTYTIRADGELVDNEGRVGVYIPDPASLLVEPQGYAIMATVKPTDGTEWRVAVGGSTMLPDVVDLVAVSSVGSVSPSVTASFDARLHALEQGSGGSGGGGGVTDHGALSGLGDDDHPQYALRSVAVNAQTTSYTLALSDAGKAVEITSAVPVDLTVPADATIALPVGSVVEVYQLGAGQVSIVAAGGVTVESRGGLLDLSGQYAVASLRKRAENTWVLAGDVS